jgi:hypothetical protein
MKGKYRKPIKSLAMTGSPERSARHETLNQGNSVGEPPPAYGDRGPDRLDDAELPRSLKEAIRRSQYAGSGKRQDPPWATALQGIENQHGRDGE